MGGQEAEIEGRGVKPERERRRMIMATSSTIHRPAAKSEERELVITRVFDAPRERIWKAWTEPEYFRTWWGPKDFTVPHISIDLRPGGKYLYCMRGAGPDGVVRDYWGTGVYKEIVPLKRLVCTDSFADEKGNVVPAAHYGMGSDFPREMLVTVTIEETNGKTTMTLRHAGVPAGEMRDMTRQGWSESFDKLAESIVTSGDRTRIIAEPGKQEIVITRTFAAPRALIFRAYAEPALIPQWWGPRRYATIVDRMDVKPGGLWRFLNRDAGGNEYAFHGVYHDVHAPERLVATFEFEGVPGHVSLETLVLEETGGRTLLTNRSVFQTVEDRDEMLKGGMEEGVAETMDRLAELLMKLEAERKAA
jgi:uncharacterized protein YndB with AHSA1/START domain